MEVDPPSIVNSVMSYAIWVCDAWLDEHVVAQFLSQIPNLLIAGIAQLVEQLSYKTSASCEKSRVLRSRSDKAPKDMAIMRPSTHDGTASRLGDYFSDLLGEAPAANVSFCVRHPSMKHRLNAS